MALLSAMVVGTTVAGVKWLEGRQANDPGPGAVDVDVRTASEWDLRSRGEDQPTSVAAHLSEEASTESGTAGGSTPLPDVGSRQAQPTSPDMSATGRMPNRRSIDDRDDSLMTVLPPSLIERARETVWDERATESLDRLMLLAFDANGDLSLDDFERIAAMQAMRDAMWPTTAEDTRAFVRDAMARGRSAGASEATLGPDDLLLHHDVDESRRLDHAAERENLGVLAATEGDRVHAELRATVVEEFQLVDDGRLAAAEFARFLRRYRAGSQQADLNGDGRTDEADLRLFLDVARPIRDE